MTDCKEALEYYNRKKIEDEKITADCIYCREHKEVVEFIKNTNGKQRVVHICNDCINWMAEVINDYYKLKNCIKE